jgi:soluble lytic murein transglycosylase-like protein
MVRTAAVLVTVLAAADPARAQAVDWSRSGGDLFGRAVVDRVEAGEAVGMTPRLPALSQPLRAAIARAAERHGLDEKLLHALVIVESAYRADAVSPAGAGGLTQLMPATARDLGVRNRFDVEENLSGGADYLARQLIRFGDLRLALAAYNAGPERVARLGRVPEIEETRNYVVSVIDCYLALAAGRDVRTAPQCRTPERVR